jgi:hypothetical protein
VCEDFINSAGTFSSQKGVRKQVLSNLLIDASIRYGDIALFKEHHEDAIGSYIKAV